MVCESTAILQMYFEPPAHTRRWQQQFFKRCSTRPGFSSAPSRIFACEPLAQWSQTELGSSMNPLLSVLSTLYREYGRLQDLFGLVPLFPCFFDGNTTSNIQFKYAARQTRKQDFEFGCADCAGTATLMAMRDRLSA